MNVKRIKVFADCKNSRTVPGVFICPCARSFGLVLKTAAGWKNQPAVRFLKQKEREFPFFLPAPFLVCFSCNPN